MAQSASISLRAVNGWRGPGALAIAFGHFGVASDLVLERYLEPITLLVDLFFVLSGILIAQVYTQKLSHVSAIPEYIVRRVGRIWPVQAAMLAVLVGYEIVKLALQTYGRAHFSSPAFNPDGLNIVPAISTNLLLIHSLGVHDRETWNFPSWSLSVEFVTYCIFAFFCLLTPFLRRCLAAVTIAGSIAILALVAPYHMRSTFDYGVFRCLAGFFAGVLCFEAVRRWRLPVWPLPTVVEILAVVLVIVWMSLSVGTWLAYAAPFVFSLLIVAFVQERGKLSRLLLMRPLQFMAELSFAIYMVHAVVLTFVLAFLHQFERVSRTKLFLSKANPFAARPGALPTVQIVHFDGWITKGIAVSLYLAAVFLIAYLTYRIVETPGRSLFGALAKRLGARAQQPTHARADADSMERAP